MKTFKEEKKLTIYVFEVLKYISPLTFSMRNQVPPKEEGTL